MKYGWPVEINLKIVHQSSFDYNLINESFN